MLGRERLNLGRGSSPFQATFKVCKLVFGSQKRHFGVNKQKLAVGSQAGVH